MMVLCVRESEFYQRALQKGEHTKYGELEGQLKTMGFFYYAEGMVKGCQSLMKSVSSDFSYKYPFVSTIDLVIKQHSLSTY